MNRLKLKRNLRRSVLRGNPWIYKDALEFKKLDENSRLSELTDQKGKFLAWGYCDLESPLSFRVLSLDKRPPSEGYFESLIKASLKRRAVWLDDNTNAYRAINGEGDRLPGLVCDVYNRVAVLQYDGTGAKRFWQGLPIAQWLAQELKVETVVDKSRGGFESLLGEDLKEPVEILENGIRFLVDIVNGQKTGFFLDQRENRNYIKRLSAKKSVMNLFSYTGGFSVYAGVGGARHVLSVDLAKPALDLAERNWKLNGLKEDVHKSEAVDIFDYLEHSEDVWDTVIVDPPSMAHSEKQKMAAVTKYTQLFAKAAKRVKPGGDLVLSSCSSHISFGDFLSLITESLSLASRRGLILRVSGQGGDHPFPHALPELRYLKFVHLELE